MPLSQRQNVLRIDSEEWNMMQERYEQQLRKQEALLNRKNEKTDFYNGIYDRWKYPVLTREHVPLYWRYDLNPETNPYFMERLGINAVFNAGAIELDGKICLVARVEGSLSFGKSRYSCRTATRTKPMSMICG